jgi:hypothetical protein
MMGVPLTATSVEIAARQRGAQQVEETDIPPPTRLSLTDKNEGTGVGQSPGLIERRSGRPSTRQT